MILLCGIPSESPLALVARELAALDAAFLVLNQRRVREWDIGFEVGADGASGWLRVEGRSLSLADVVGVYPRMMDERELPEVKASAPGSFFRELCRARHETLQRWIELTPARVLNRAAAMGSNSSKPYQAQLIAAAGLDVPETLVTNDPALVLAFRRRHGRIVYKSASSARSIVREFEDADERRLGSIRHCPTQFQAYVPGVNVRVHVVGEALFATEIRTGVVDYRYAARDGVPPPELAPLELEPELARRCLALARALEQPLAGIDLKLAPDGRAHCFEVNPSPAFSYYETHTGQPIARAIARHLCGRDAAGEGAGEGAG